MDCDHKFIPVQKKKAASLAGVTGAAIFLLVGVPLAFFNLIAGVLFMILGVVISMSNREKTVMVCEKCGAEPTPTGDAWG